MSINDNWDYLTRVTANTNNFDWNGTTTTTSPSTWWYSSPIYLYQIFCPKKGCKQANWLRLDTITPCTKCGSKLKAVSESADYEVPVSG